MKTNAIIRITVLVILLLNQTLVGLGYNPLPFSDEQIYEGVSAVATAIMAIITAYKDNPVTKEAQLGTAVTRNLKDKKVSKDEADKFMEAKKAVEGTQ